MQQQYEIKPNKTVFVTYRFLISSFFIFIFFTIVYLVINWTIKGTALYFISAFVIWRLVSYYLLNIKYNKEKYIFLQNKIIHKSGSIFSDNETELVIRNITHVTLRLPFIENKLYFNMVSRSILLCFSKCICLEPYVSFFSWSYTFL